MDKQYETSIVSNPFDSLLSGWSGGEKAGAVSSHRAEPKKVKSHTNMAVTSCSHTHLMGGFFYLYAQSQAEERGQWGRRIG